MEAVGHYRLASQLTTKQPTEGDWLEAARAVGAHFIARGTVEPAGQEVRVTLVLDDIRGQTINTWSGVVRTREVPNFIRNITSDIASQTVGYAKERPALQPEFEFERHYLTGVAALQEHRLSDAIASLKEALVMDPNSAEALYHLAIASWWAEQPREEVEAAIDAWPRPKRSSGANGHS